MMESKVSGRRFAFKRILRAKYSAAKLAMKNFKARSMRVAQKYQKATEIGGKANKYLGRVAVAMSFLGAAYMFSQGEIGRGIAAVGMGTFNLATDIVTNVKPLKKLVTKAAMRTSTFVAKKFVSVASKIKTIANTAMAVEKAGSRLASLLERAVPAVGVLLGLYAIGEDIARLANDDGKDVLKTVVMAVNLAMDIAITGLMVAAQFFPPLEILVFALTILRMALESVVDGISEALKNCGNRNKVGCFVSGVLSGLGNLLTGGYGAQVKAMAKEEKGYRQKIKDLNNIESYMNISGSCSGNEPALINFNAGTKSSYGGGITFELFDNQDYKITVEGTPIYDSGTHVSTKTLHCKMLRNIVLGLGVTAHFDYETRRAKFWGFIPGVAFRMIKAETLEESSMKGTYYGNDKDNSFHAVKGAVIESGDDCNRLNKSNVMASTAMKYQYRLYGRGGNDRFILGPEKTNVQGGDGSDTYMISSVGGNIEIDNFATDEATDHLILDTSHDKIDCNRDEKDLLIHYCGTHQVRVKKYFLAGDSENHKHLTIGTKDNFELNVFHASTAKDAPPTYSCWLTGIDLSQSEVPQDIDLTDLNRIEYRYVRNIVGSKSTNRLSGNEFDNTFVGAGRTNYMSAKGGNDQYILHKSSSNEIDNCDTSEELLEDRIQFPLYFDQLEMSNSKGDLRISSEKNQFHLTLLKWFSDPKCSHATLLTKDKMVFIVREENGKLVKVPYILDESSKSSPVRINLKTHKAPHIEDDVILTDVKSIISSKYADHIVGDAGDNMFVGRGRGVYLEGGNGEDTYHIDKSSLVFVNFTSIDNKPDTVKVDCKRKDLAVCFYEPTNPQLLMLVSCDFETLRYHVATHSEITNPVEWQYIKTKELAAPCEKNYMINHKISTIGGKPKRLSTIETSDGFTFIIHQSMSAFGEYIRYLKVDALEINDREHDLCCTFNMENEMYLEDEHYLEDVTRVKISVNATSSKITGNDEGNSFRPGKKLESYESNIEGGNGSDAYIIMAGDGMVVINNYAEDKLIDTLLLYIPFDDVAVAFEAESGTVLLFDKTEPKRTRVKILNYWKSVEFRHLIIRSTDHIKYVIVEDYPHKAAESIDLSSSKYPEYIQLNERDPVSYGSVKQIHGSHEASNVIFGTLSSEQILGGRQNDSIDGGPTGEFIEGLEGNDLIWGRGGDDYIKGGKGNDTVYAGDGNDIIYGGTGRDLIFGGRGFDFVVFSGGVKKRINNIKPCGVTVNLKNKAGREGDAEGDYLSGIEGVMGTVFSDEIWDNDGNNEIDGGPGNDKFKIQGGNDRLVGGSGSDTYDLSKASGVKTIDNYDNSSLIHTDDLVVPDFNVETMTNPAVKVCSFSDNGLSGPRKNAGWDETKAKTAVRYSFLTKKDLNLILTEDLTVVLKDWAEGNLHQHIKVWNYYVTLPLTDIRPDLDLSGIKPPTLLITDEESNSIRLEHTCEQCVALNVAVEVYYSGKYDEKFKAMQFVPGKDHLTVADLHRGDTYHFVPILTHCKTLVETGKTLTLTRSPNPPKEVKTLVVDNHLIQVSWDSENPVSLEHTFSVTLRIKLLDKTKRWHIYSEAFEVLGNSLIVPAKTKNATSVKVSVKIETKYLHKKSKRVSRHFEDNPSITCEEGLTGSHDLLSKTLNYCIQRQKKICTNANEETTALESNSVPHRKHRDHPVSRPLSATETMRASSKSEGKDCSALCQSPILFSKNLKPENAQTKTMLHAYSVFQFGETVLLACQRGYKFQNYEGENFSTRCLHSAWTPSIPQCFLDCPSPPLISDGNLTVTKGTAIYSCNPAYFLLGQSLLTCKRNVWHPVEESVCLIPEYDKYKPKNIFPSKNPGFLAGMRAVMG